MAIGTVPTLNWLSSFELGKKEITTLGVGATDADCTIAIDATKARSGVCSMRFADTANISNRTITVSNRSLIVIGSLRFDGGVPAGPVGGGSLLKIVGGPYVEIRPTNTNWWWAKGATIDSVRRLRIFRDSVSLTVPVFDSGYFRSDVGGGDTGVPIVHSEYYTVILEMFRMDGATLTAVSLGPENGLSGAGANPLHMDDVSIWYAAPPGFFTSAPLVTVKKPTANAATGAWTASAGNKYDCVNENASPIPDDDTTYIFGPADGSSQQRFTYAALAAGTNILGVSLWGRVKSHTGSFGGNLLLVFSDGTVSASWFSGSNQWQNSNIVRSRSGAGAILTVGEINAVEIGVGNAGGSNERRCSLLVLEIIHGPTPRLPHNIKARSYPR